jgi:hypothetical protein
LTNSRDHLKYPLILVTRLPFENPLNPPSFPEGVKYTPSPRPLPAGKRVKIFFVGFYFAAEKADTKRAGRGGVKKGPKRRISFRNLGQE